MKRRLLENMTVLILILLLGGIVGSSIMNRDVPPINTSTVLVRAGDSYGTGVALSQTKILTAKHVLTHSALSNMYVVVSSGVTNQVDDILYLTKTDAAVLTFDGPLDIEVPEYTLTEPEVGSFVYTEGWGNGMFLYKGGLVGGEYISHGKRVIEAHLSVLAGDSGSAVYSEGKVFGIILYGGHIALTGILPVSAFKELL